jgi:hypothetical protein
MRCAGHIAYIWKKRNAYIVFVGKPEGKRLLRKPRRRWEDNIVTWKIEETAVAT